MKRYIKTSFSMHDLKKVNDRTYVAELGNNMYLNIRQVWGDDENYTAGQWKWDLTDGHRFIKIGEFGWDSPESAAEDFYFRHPEYDVE